MGCDGGTIPKRHELVKTARQPVKKDPSFLRQAKWTTCSISQQGLMEPVVACELGKLYSKESVLEFLLDRTICETASHIRNLKDVKVLKLTHNPGFKKSVSHLADQYMDSQRSPYVCPIVGIEMSGKYKFCFLWSCGCVLSERAIKEVESDVCHNCGTKFIKDDVIILYPEDGDLELMKDNMMKRREKLKALKKEKKDKKAGDKRKSEDVSVNNSKDVFKVPQPLGSEDAIKSKDVNTKQKSKESKSKVAKLNGEAKKAKETNASKVKKQSDFIDPKTTKVYKNLFTSGEKDKKQNSAHWITYNPYHL